MNELQSFDYRQVSAESEMKLRQYESGLFQAENKAKSGLFEMGEYLQAIHDELANYHGGLYGQWLATHNYTPVQAKRLTDSYKFVLTNCQNRDYIESLPRSLVYEVAKESAPKELKKGVLNGDIKTLKQYREKQTALKESSKGFDYSELPTELAKQLQKRETEIHRLIAETRSNFIKFFASENDFRMCEWFSKASEGEILDLCCDSIAERGQTLFGTIEPSACQQKGPV